MDIRFSTRLRRSLAGSVLALLLSSPATQADTVWTIASGTGAKPFAREKMKIEGINAGGLLFRSLSQDRAAEPKPLKEIWRIQVDDEAALNTAETAYVAEKWDDAVAGYQKTITTTRKDWVKQYSTFRLILSAEKSGKFSALATAYVARVLRSPTAASDGKPAVPKNAKPEVTAAITTVKNALGETRLPAPQKNTLQAFLAELYIANGQLKEAESLGIKAGAAAAAPAPTLVNKPADRIAAPAAPAVQADAGNVGLKLQLAIADIKQKKFQQAIDAIDAIAPSLNDPEQQADALFTVAEAKAGLAGGDANKLKDAALSYMRVVAHFKNKPDAPHVAESLFKSGVVLEQAKLFPDALAAYKAVQSDFKDSPHASDAAAGAARVQKAIEEAKG